MAKVKLTASSKRKRRLRLGGGILALLVLTVVGLTVYAELTGERAQARSIIHTCQCGWSLA